MTGQPKNKNALTHGIYSLDKGNGIKVLEPFELDNLQDLRDLVKSGDGRLAIRDEIIARLVLISRKFFNDAFNNHNSPSFWRTPTLARGGTYLAELRRWLDAYPDDQKTTVTLIQMLRGDGDDNDDPKD